MMTKPNSVSVLMCGLSVCLLAFTASAQLPLRFYVDGNCQVEVPDFTNEDVWTELTEIYGLPAPPWSFDNQLDQFPEAGIVTPGEITDDDWEAAFPPEDFPGAYPFPDWPTQTMTVYVKETVDDVKVLHEVVILEDNARPFLRNNPPSLPLYQRLTYSGTPPPYPDFRPTLRPFIADNCSAPDLLVMGQVPAPGTPVPTALLPAGLPVVVSVTDEHGNTSEYPVRVEVFDVNDTRPVITPNGVNPVDRRFDAGFFNRVSYWTDYWECGISFVDPGATAKDYQGNDITPQIQSRIENDPVTSVISNGAVAFTVRYWIGEESDLANNGMAERRMVVKDGSKPVITLGQIGGDSSGAQTIYRAYNGGPPAGWEEPEWVQALRETENPPYPWITSLPTFDFVPQPWDDATTMPWRCTYLSPYEEFLDVDDACEGRYDQEKMDERVLVVIVRVRMASAEYADGQETFYAGGTLGEMRNAGLELPWGRPPTTNPWYGYRIYYFVRDYSGNLNYVSRHVRPETGGGIIVAEPRTLTFRCDDDVLQRLYDVERGDRAVDACSGIVSDRINRTGEIAQTPDGYFVPGTYYRYYTIEGGQTWPDPWRRTIIVEETPPEVHLYNEEGDEVSSLSAESLVVVRWCDFRNQTGATPEEQVEAWADTWWPARSEFDPDAPFPFGYSASQVCEDNVVLTSRVDPKGVQALKDIMLDCQALSESAGPYQHLLGAYEINYVLDSPAHALVNARRPVLLIEDLKLDLNISTLGTAIREESGGTVITMECGAGIPFTLPEITGTRDACSGMAVDRDISLEVFDTTGGTPVKIPASQISTDRPGVYALYYSTSYASLYGPVPVPVRTVVLIVKDTTPPLLTLNGAASVTVECRSAYTEARATALDACAGDLSASIEIYQSVNTAVVGQYPVNYAVADAQGNRAQATRTVNVVDTTKPVITLEGQRDITLMIGGPGYVEFGYHAADVCVGDLTSSVVVDNTINMNVPGVYKVNYSVTDASGNTATESRTVRVKGVRIVLQGAATVYVNCINEFIDPGVTAQRYVDGVLTTVTGSIQTATETTETGALIRYWVPGFESETVTRTLVANGTYGMTLMDVDDVEPLPSGHPYAPGDYFVTWWDCKAPYDDPGVFAWDDCLGGAPVVTVSGVELVDSSEANQQFEVVYSARLRGKEYHRVRLVKIEDNSPPVLSLKGAGLSVITPGGTPSWLSAAVTRYVQVYGSTEGLPEAWPVLEEWNPRTTPLTVHCDRAHYEDPGALAYDLCSGEIAAEDILFVMTYWNTETKSEEFRFIGNMSDFNFPDNPANPLPRLLDDNPSDPNVQGHYRTYYYTRDESGLETMSSRAIEVEFFVTITGLEPYREIPCSNTPYDPLAGVRVIDLCEGDLTSTLIVTGKVNTQVPGQYKLRYDHRGSYGLWELPFKEAVVEVVDRQKPEIILLDEGGVPAELPATLYIPWCAKQTDLSWWSQWFAVLPNKGFVVEDTCDDSARLTNEVRVSGVKELSTALDVLSNPNLSATEREAYFGVYTLRYNVVDASGNVATPAYRHVAVGSMPAFNLGSFEADQMSEDGYALVTCLQAPYAEPPDFAVASPCPNDPVTVLPYVPGATAPPGTWFWYAGALVLDSNGHARMGSDNKPVWASYEQFHLAMGNYLLVYVLANPDMGYVFPPLNADERPDVVAGDGSVRILGPDGQPTVPWARLVRVQGAGNPVITLLGQTPLEYECGTTFTDPGAAAMDACQGDLTDSIAVSGLNTAAIGTYVMTYTVSDALGNAAQPVTRTVKVKDTQPPVITLTGVSPGEPVRLPCGIDINLYPGPGTAAMDACDGDISDKVQMEGPVLDAQYPGLKPGETAYTLTYTVSDGAGNEAVPATCTVIAAGLVIVLNDPVVDSGQYVTDWACGKPYVDPGVSGVLDACTGTNYPPNVVQISGIPTAPPKRDFEVTYSFTKPGGGQSVLAVRHVRVDDAEGPEITLVGVGEPPVTGETPVEPLAENAPVPEWWQVALEKYGVLYPEDSLASALPEAWRIAEGWDTSLSDPLPWNCNVPAYEDPGASVEDVCEGALDTANVVLILTQYNAVEQREYFRYVGRFGDFAANPPGHAYDDEGVETELRNLREDMTDAAVWAGYRAYYLAWDASGNYAVKSRLIAPHYVMMNAAPAEVTVECGDAFPVLVFTAESLCGDVTLDQPKRWIWRRNPETGLQMMEGVPVMHTEEAVVAETGNYVVVYAVTDSLGNSVPPLDDSGVPLDPVALVEAGGPYLQEITVQDTTAPKITLEGGESINVPYYVAFIDPGYAALDSCEGDLTAAVVMEGVVDPMTLGLQTVLYRVTDGAGNIGQATRTVNVVDISAPEISLNPTNVTWECGTVYTDLGVSARDAQDGTDLTALIQVVGLVPELAGPSGARPGTYAISYTVSRYPGGNSDSKQRIASVIDSESPVIVLNGEANITLDCGSEYVDAGVLSALDQCDGDLAGDVMVSGIINPLNLGLQTLTYSVSDDAGNVVQEVRTVNIVDESQPEIIVDPVAITLECGEVYQDTGVTARDNADGSDLTASIRKSGLVSNLMNASGARPGTYEITYYVQPVAGCNDASASRTVRVVDSQPPVITLRGAAEVSVDCGANYRDAGVLSALDECDGDLRGRVVQIGNVDSNMPGLQTVVFSVKDQSGNEGSAIRKVTVRDNCTIEEGETSEGELPFEGEITFEGEGGPYAQTQVPDVMAETVNGAQTMVISSNLVVGEVTRQYSDEMPEGRVISQSPPPGTVVDVQSQVDLVVSAGPAGCGCEGLDGVDWGYLFLGVLAATVLLIVSLSTDGGLFKL